MKMVAHASGCAECATKESLLSPAAVAAAVASEATDHHAAAPSPIGIVTWTIPAGIITRVVVGVGSRRQTAVAGARGRLASDNLRRDRAFILVRVHVAVGLR